MPLILFAQAPSCAAQPCMWGADGGAKALGDAGDQLSRLELTSQHRVTLQQQYEEEEAVEQTFLEDQTCVPFAE